LAMAGKTARGRALVSGVRVHPERNGGDKQREKGSRALPDSAGNSSSSRARRQPEQQQDAVVAHRCRERWGRGSRACVHERNRGFCFFRERKREERWSNWARGGVGHEPKLGRTLGLYPAAMSASEIS
jgi:hypothetical protein